MFFLYNGIKVSFMKSKFFQKTKAFNNPFKIAIMITLIALIISLALEWLFTQTITTTTMLITIPVAFLLTYILTGIMLRYQRLLDEKNALLHKMTYDLQCANETMAAQNTDLDSFAQTVAHELKNPLAVILGYSYLLGKKEYQENPTTLEEIGERITETSLKMNSIIEEILLLASLRQNCGFR